jgi:hypothetical protein
VVGDVEVGGVGQYLQDETIVRSYAANELGTCDGHAEQALARAIWVDKNHGGNAHGRVLGRGKLHPRQVVLGKSCQSKGKDLILLKRYRADIEEGGDEK